MNAFGSHFFWEALEACATWGALLSGLEAADDVLKCGCHNKIFLLQTKFLSFKELQRIRKATDRVKGLFLCHLII